jgi:hypothetical protein
MSKNKEQLPQELPEFVKPIKSDRPRPVLGSLIIILLLVGIIGLGLIWLDLPLPDFIASRLPERDANRPPPFTTEDVQGAWQNMLTKLQEARAGAATQDGSDAARQTALDKLGEAQQLLEKWREEGAPRLKAAAEELSKKTGEAMDAVRNGSLDAREKLEELIGKVNQLKEEKEPDKL